MLRRKKGFINNNIKIIPIREEDFGVGDNDNKSMEANNSDLGSQDQMITKNNETTMASTIDISIPTPLKRAHSGFGRYITFDSSSELEEIENIKDFEMMIEVARTVLELKKVGRFVVGLN
jgi:hypothetical protein